MDRRAFIAGSLALTAAPPTRSRREPTLSERFLSPPPSARPHTWWHWMNGNITREGITADLEAMAQAGIGGAQIFNVDERIPPGKVKYFSDEWRALVVHAAKEAKRLGLELCFHNCAGWSSSGGPWIDPAHSMQILTFSETKVQGGRNQSVTLPEPRKSRGHYVDIAVVAFPTPADESFRNPDIRNKAFFDRGSGGISMANAPDGAILPLEAVRTLACRPDGAITLDLPAGEWTLLRVGHTSTGKDNHPAPESGRGLECDKLSAEALDLHWEKGVAPLLRDLGPELVGSVFNNALIDSYEVGTQNWTPKLRAEFFTRCGYDPVPWLASATGYIIASAEQTERFLWDLRRTCADLFAQNYAGRFREHCHKNNMQFSVEPYGNGSMDNLQVGALGDIMMGEFWVPGGMASETIKIAASCAHTQGRKIVGAESFTAGESEGRWQVEPYSIKALGDKMFAQGVNRYIFHRYAHQPWMNVRPGMTMGPWGSHLERTQTWWKQAATWLKYVARCQFLLQSGSFVADVLTLSGDDAPGDLYRPGLPPGYDYDGCDRTTLLGAKVERGEIVLSPGARYKLLMIPDSAWLTPQTTKKLAELSRAGARIVGRRPEKSPSRAGFPACDTDVRALGSQLKLMPLEQALPAPDVILPKGAPLVWIHRRTADAEIYFVSNQRYTQQRASVGFRAVGRAPELWHPETGETEPAPLWQAGTTHTNVTLQLGPAESVFVVFRKGAKPGKSFVKIERTGGTTPLPKPPVVEILSARYESTDGAGGANVTAKVKAMVEAGESEIAATNTNFGDPTVNRVKRLIIRFTLDGKFQEKSAQENETLVLLGSGPDNALPEFQLTGGRLLAYAPGTYALTDARGRVREFAAPAPREVELTGWTLTFPGSAPLTLEKLLSWPELSEFDQRYFSGTATYRASFTHTPDPTRAIILDLGIVKNFADVALNGQRVATLWKAPWRLDISALVRPGVNTLEVDVTNLWVNRLIGDEQLPPEEGVEWTGRTGPIKALPNWLVEGRSRPATKRFTFTTWRYWTKEDRPLDSGLLGPARLLLVPAPSLP